MQWFSRCILQPQPTGQGCVCVAYVYSVCVNGCVCGVCEYMCACLWCICVCVCGGVGVGLMCICVCVSVLTDLSAAVGCITRSIFKRNSTGLKKDFSFYKKTSLINYLPIAQRKIVSCILFPSGWAICKTETA